MGAIRLWRHKPTRTDGRAVEAPSPASGPQRTAADAHGFCWKVLTIAGSLLLGACVIVSELVIASVHAERHRERRQYAHYTTIALGLDRYLTKTLDEALSAEHRIAIDAIYAKAPAVSPGHR